MRLTSSLCRQHIQRMFKKHWHVQRNRRVADTRMEDVLIAKNLRVIDPKELFIKPKTRLDISIEPLVPKPHPVNNSHPDWQDTPCLSYRDDNVLLEGENQAMVLTKTVLIANELPETVNNLMIDHNEQVNKLVLRALHTSHIFDAHQELLPKRKDPARPAWVFPREYGITDLRRTRYISQNLFQLCESLSGPQVAFERNLIHNGIVKVPIEKDGNLLQFTLRADLLLASTSPLKAIGSKEDGNHINLPDLYPIDSTITLKPENVYKLQNLYPLDKKSQWMNAHTIFIYYDPSEVKNLYETPVTETQIFGRSLLKSFAVAASYARQRFGDEIVSLPEPVVIQCIHSDGKFFHFSVFQLNTLDLNGSDGEKNLWWSSPKILLFERAGYDVGKPIIEKYNPEVFKRIFAFYSNN
ncbi:39S ribosomal protein L37, mitochondrial [Athalia rosae]|uniref:39S ribosomal protein L37, mitochondrial n=1 Tax=Athalia rosae TaxID=37344 RepID=UPI00203471A4|nr:39S ribosomal protein L37, mitochondrial [Athalia rosae]XP_012251358.2 39S ribosomal protein L37, mitochondrial [Athalia rosae]XP_020706562.2 39S ribosomal protein L37, mitochondrial [Athalia rosae]